MKILLISKHFPPRPSALSLQAGKIAASLMQSNANLRIIAGTDSSANYSSRDYSGFDSSNIYRVPYRGGIATGCTIADSLYRIWLEMNETNHYSPWIRKSSLLAKKIAMEFEPDVILSISNPFDSHLVAWNLFCEKKRPWLASFSDPYPASFAPPPYNKACRTRFMVAWQIRALRKIINAASGLHFHSKYTVKPLQSATKYSIEEKAFTIPHIGYMGDFRNLNTNTQGNGWLAHIGYINRERCAPEVLHGLKDCFNKYPHLFKGLMCVGGVAPEFIKLAGALNLTDKLNLIGKVDYESAIRIGSNSTALLLLEANMPYSAFLPSKIADYATMKRPILAITPTQSATRNYINNFNVGIAVEHDSQQISSALYRIISNAANNFYNVNSFDSFAYEFSSKKIGLQLLSTLKEMTLSK